MNAYIALLRAINVMGTGKLPVTELKKLCEAAGFKTVRTYIASGNVVFKSSKSEAKVKATLEAEAAAYIGKPVGVLIRTAAEMAAILSSKCLATAPLPASLTALPLQTPSKPPKTGRTSKSSSACARFTFTSPTARANRDSTFPQPEQGPSAT